MAKLLAPIHPGEILREDVLKRLNMSVIQLAKSLAVDAARLNEIVRGRRGITPDTALRLARYLGTMPEFWLKLRRGKPSSRRSSTPYDRDPKPPNVLWPSVRLDPDPPLSGSPAEWANGLKRRGDRSRALSVL
jgi:addiction module HigA family antidote